MSARAPSNIQIAGKTIYDRGLFDSFWAAVGAGHIRNEVAALSFDSAVFQNFCRSFFIQFKLWPFIT
jgi:hypothetical protein